MQAIVLAGGYATRLWPITRNRPKMFLPTGDATVIDAILEDLETDDRIDEVYVSTNDRFADDFQSFLDDRPYEKPRLSIEDTTEEDEKFGVVGALAQLVDRENIDDDALVVAGDNVISFDLSEFLDYFEERQSPTLAAYDVGSPERASSYGTVSLNGSDEVQAFEEKPEDPDTSLVSIACYAFTAENLASLDEYLADGNNPDEPGWFLQWLQSREPVYAFSFDGAWFDIGTADGYLEAVAWTLDGDSHVADDAELNNATVGDNVQVMDGATIEDSHVESSVIFPDATIRESEVRDSIIDEQTLVDDRDLSGALIGAHSEVTNGH